MKIAIEGCAHGDLDRIYETIEYAEKTRGVTIDLLLICGDFQAVRNHGDMECLACPKKYREMKDFYKYYSGEKVAPKLTIFIGGNHEASNHLRELYHGGWVAPNIYFLGFAGVVRVGGLRIGGLSGIFKGSDYNKGHFEKVPYDDSSMRSIYHVKAYNVWKLKQIREPMDVFLSHDWPQGIAFHGDKQTLLRKKKFLKDEVERNTLGSRPNLELLQQLQPRFWFSAHLHVKFPAVYRHTAPDGSGGHRAGEHTGTPQASKKIRVGRDGGESVAEVSAQGRSGDDAKATKFLALSKCLPGQDYLQVVDIPDATGPPVLSYDEEWLAILRLADPFFTANRNQGPLPERFSAEEIEQERARVRTLVSDLTIPQNFEVTSPAYDPQRPNVGFPAQVILNPQMVAFLEKLELSDNTSTAKTDSGSRRESLNPNEINIDDVEEEDDTVEDPDEDDDCHHPDVAFVGPSPRPSITSSPGTVTTTQRQNSNSSPLASPRTARVSPRNSPAPSPDAPPKVAASVRPSLSALLPPPKSSSPVMPPPDSPVITNSEKSVSQGGVSNPDEISLDDDM